MNICFMKWGYYEHSVKIAEKFELHSKTLYSSCDQDKLVIFVPVDRAPFILQSVRLIRLCPLFWFNSK